MMRSVFLKTLYDRRWFMLGWVIGMAALSVLMVSFFPAMRQDGSFDALVANMPAAFEGMIGDLANLKTFDLYIASQLFDIRMPILVATMAIILGLGLSVREEESGELRTLLALPVSRTKVLVQNWLAMAVIMLIVTGGLVVGIYVTMPFLEDVVIDWQDMAALGVMTWLVMMTFGTITYATGRVTGSRSVAMLVGTIVCVGSFLLTTFAQAVDWLEPYEPWSLLHYFPAVDIVKDGVTMVDVMVLGSVTLIALILAILVFRRRDVK